MHILDITSRIHIHILGPPGRLKGVSGGADAPPGIKTLKILIIIPMSQCLSGLRAGARRELPISVLMPSFQTGSGMVRVEVCKMRCSCPADHLPVHNSKSVEGVLNEAIL